MRCMRCIPSPSFRYSKLICTPRPKLNFVSYFYRKYTTDEGVISFDADKRQMLEEIETNDQKLPEERPLTVYPAHLRNIHLRECLEVEEERTRSFLLRHYNTTEIHDAIVRNINSQQESIISSSLKDDDGDNSFTPDDLLDMFIDDATVDSTATTQGQITEPLLPLTPQLDIQVEQVKQEQSIQSIKTFLIQLTKSLMLKGKTILVEKDRVSATGRYLLVLSPFHIDMANESIKNEQDARVLKDTRRRVLFEHQKFHVQRLDEYLRQYESLASEKDPILSLLFLFAYSLLRSPANHIVTHHFADDVVSSLPNKLKRLYYIVRMYSLYDRPKEALKLFLQVKANNNWILKSDAMLFYESIYVMVRHQMNREAKDMYNIMVNRYGLPPTKKIQSLMIMTMNTTKEVMGYHALNQVEQLHNKQSYEYVLHHLTVTNQFELLMEFFESVRAKPSHFEEFIKQDNNWYYMFHAHYKKLLMDGNRMDRHQKELMVTSALNMMKHVYEYSKPTSNVMLCMVAIYSLNDEIIPMWQIVKVMCRLDLAKSVMEMPYVFLLETAVRLGRTENVFKIFNWMTRHKVVARDLTFYHDLLDGFHGTGDVLAFDVFSTLFKSGVLVDEERLRKNVSTLADVYGRLGPGDRQHADYVLSQYSGMEALDGFVNNKIN
ncbi:hypothetical protein AKO1_002137 [Acrasis kona]|uniref:Pentatricopeptide repeat-containing protein n=1 Tax=Acrasis kona TaxID=1008807 RepID=A0AAW2Z7U1_9EUKA